MNEAPPFELRGGRVILAGRRVLHDVDFRFTAGEFVVLLGANGSGKTTLIRTLLGLVPVAAGEVRLFGAPLQRFREWRRVGYVPQRFTAAAGVPATVGEVALSGRIAHVRWPARYGARDRDAARRALDIVGLTELATSPVSSLSGGQQQRVLIARALAAEPDVLVLDEPVSGVDLESQASFAATLGRLHDEGRSVLLVAHALGVMEDLVGRTVVLAAGRVAYDGPPREQHAAVPHEHHHPGDERRHLHPTPERAP
ncbi:MAG: metal ABC transporter ATP-binding protein [Actinomycetota bacterium]